MKWNQISKKKKSSKEKNKSKSLSDSRINQSSPQEPNYKEDSIASDSDDSEDSNESCELGSDYMPDTYDKRKKHKVNPKNISRREKDCFGLKRKS